MNEYISTRFKNYSLQNIIENENSIDFYLQPDSYEAICPYCYTTSTSIHQTRKRMTYDLPYKGKSVTIHLNIRTFKCRNKKCNHNTFTENIEFINSNSNYTKYVIDELMKMKDQSIRTIRSKMLEQYNLKMSTSTIHDLIKLNKEKYQDNTKIVKYDKKQLEENINEKIDIVHLVGYTAADYILETTEENYKVIEQISKSFKDLNDYPTTYPYEMFILSGIASRLKGMTSTSSMPFALTNVSSIAKIGYNILKTRIDGTYFSSGAFRDYLLSTNESILQQAFNSFSYEILKKNQIEPKIHIIDATKIEVNMYNGNYENASCITDIDKVKRKGYKLTSLYGIYEDQLVNESNIVTTLSEHDVKAGAKLLENNPCIKANDIILMDRGYLSFELFYELNEKEIKIITPARKNSEVMKEALSLSGIKIKDKNEKVKANDNKEIKWKKHPIKKRESQEYHFVRDITIYSEQTDTKSCKKLKVNGVVIRFSKKETIEESYYYEDENYRYACIYTTDLEKSGKDIIELYEKRMKIEDQFKQLKSRFELNRLTSTKYIFIVFQILTTVAALGLVKLFTLLKEGAEYKNQHLKTMIMKMDVLKKYKKIDLLISSKDVYCSYKTSEIIELALSLSEKVRNELIYKLKKEESNEFN